MELTENPDLSEYRNLKKLEINNNKLTKLGYLPDKLNMLNGEKLVFANNN